MLTPRCSLPERSCMAQMREIAEQVYDLLALHYPILFEDLKASIKRAQ